MENTADQPSFPDDSQLIDVRPAVLIQVVLLGVILGAVSWVLTLLADRFVLNAVLCGAEASMCASKPAIAGNISLVLVSIAGLLALVRLGVYRPLLIAIASVIVLWGTAGWVSGLFWYEALAWTIALYAATFAAFTWLVRPRLFLAAIMLVLVVVLLARILPALS